MKHIGIFRVAALILLIAFAQPASAEYDVDLELVLLADATGSIDDAEIAFQREGYAQAITSPEVIAAIRNGPHGKIALTYVEWGDTVSQETVVEWMIIDGQAAANIFAKALCA